MVDSNIGLGGDGVGGGPGGRGGGASPNIFDVFADGEAPYAGIRAKYGRADADWSARGVAVVPAVKSSALLPISGSMVDGWSFTFKPGFLSAAEEANGWKLIRRERVDAIAEIPAVAASLQYRVRGSGQSVTITATVAGAAGNNIGVKVGRGSVQSTEYAVSGAGTRFDILRGTDGLSISQLIREANAYYSRIVFSANSGSTSNSINVNLPSSGVGYAFMTGGVDAIPAVPAEPISFGFDAVAEEITVSIKATDTLAAIRGSNEFRTVFSPFAEATAVGTVDEATATFVIPANDPGIVFAGGKNGNPLGVEIDPLLNTIDIRYDPSTNTLADIFGVMQAAGVSPEYRGSGAATNTPEAIGWVRSVGPLTAASPGTGTTTASALSAAQIKQRYESNANTNAFTDTLRDKLNGVDAGAADDQTGAEIKAAYEGEADTNAFTNAEKGKLDGIAAGATVTSIGGVSLPVVSLGRPTAVEAKGLTFATPTGYPATGSYPRGTLISFNLGTFATFASSSSSISIYIGTDRYDFYETGTGSLSYPRLITDTEYLVVAQGSGTLQLLAPYKQDGPLIKAAYEAESDTNAFTNALKTKLEGVATAATAVSIADVLAKILPGTGINIDKTVGNQITIKATATGGGGGTADGVVTSAVLAADTEIVTFTTSTGGAVTLDLGAFTTAAELTTALTPYTKADGTVPFTAVVAGVTPTLDPHLSTKKYVDDADGLSALLTGATFTGPAKGRTPVDPTDFVTLGYFGMHRNVSPIVDDLYFGTSDDDIPVGTEFNVQGVVSTGSINAYVGNKHLLIARLSTEADIRSVMLSSDASGNNQFGGFTKFATTVSIPNKAGVFNVWVSNQAITNAALLVITVG